MERRGLLFFILSVLSLWSSLVLARSQISLPEKDDHRGRAQTYIVHVRKPKSLLLRSARDRENWHKSFLPSLTLDSGEPRLVYSYEHAIGGFAARLTPQEAEAMEAADGVLSVQPDGELKQRTTHSPKFLGLTESGQLWEKTNGGEGMVIGVLEFGFNSTHESFYDFDMPPPPSRWKGECTLHPENCNNKLIGNKLFNAAGNYDPADPQTHGTHVAGIAAGKIVVGASFRGEACGTASGAAPRAHLAFYSGNSYADWLMAVDTAIKDGVNVLSISIGPSRVHPFYSNPIDIATLAAAKHDIFVSVAAGNKGPNPRSLEDSAPWTLSVGASTMDRATKVQIILGNGDILDGESIYVKRDFFPVGAPLPASILEHSSSPGSCWENLLSLVHTLSHGSTLSREQEGITNYFYCRCSKQHKRVHFKGKEREKNYSYALTFSGTTFPRFLSTFTSNPLKDKTQTKENIKKTPLRLLFFLEPRSPSLPHSHLSHFLHLCWSRMSSRREKIGTLIFSLFSLRRAYFLHPRLSRSAHSSPISIPNSISELAG